MMRLYTKYTLSTGHFWVMRPVHLPAIGLGLLLLFLSPATASAQGDWDLGFTAGMSNYMGDIGDGFSSRRDFIWDMQELRTRPAFGVYARRKLDRDGLWWVRGDFMSINIAGHDKHTDYEARQGRNLHFRNRMREASFRVERDLFQKPLVWARQRRAMVTVRAFVGFAYFEHSPEAQVDLNNPAYTDLVERGITSEGEWHSLPELQTEGIDYSNQLSMTTVPFGLSAVVTGQKKGGAADFYVGIELGIRLTGTDYLDDISSFYADPSEMGALGAALSSQANEVVMEEAGISHSVVNHQWHSDDHKVVRGNPVNNDAYGTLVVSFGKVLNGRSNSFNRSRSRYGNKRRGGLFKKRTRMRF
jgi:hypothetical protein